jgi:hypothetical protein
MYLQTVGTKQKNLGKKFSFFVGVLKDKDENTRIWIHLPESRIRTKMSRIYNESIPALLGSREKPSRSTMRA